MEDDEMKELQEYLNKEDDTMNLLTGKFTYVMAKAELLVTHFILRCITFKRGPYKHLELIFESMPFHKKIEIATGFLKYNDPSKPDDAKNYAGFVKRLDELKGYYRSRSDLAHRKQSFSFDHGLKALAKNMTKAKANRPEIFNENIEKWILEVKIILNHIDYFMSIADEIREKIDKGGAPYPQDQPTSIFL